jgi:hypothetical protein
MRYIACIVLLAAALLTAGCTNENKNVNAPPPITITPASTLPVSLLPTLTEKPTQDNTGDRTFLEAVGICYNNTPAITDTKTNLEFTICMQHTPISSGTCARLFRSEILEYTTKDDGTTAGNKRSTENMQIARVRFSECLNRLY